MDCCAVDALAFSDARDPDRAWLTVKDKIHFFAESAERDFTSRRRIHHLTVPGKTVPGKLNSGAILSHCPILTIGASP